jgi:hypothetical protein
LVFLPRQWQIQIIGIITLKIVIKAIISTDTTTAMIIVIHRVGQMRIAAIDMVNGLS